MMNTDTNRLVMVMALGLTLFMSMSFGASLPDLATIDEFQRANRDLTPTGYCEIRITDVRLKENLLSAREIPEGIRLQQLPILTSDQDAHLGGHCWFKWQGDRFASFEKRFVSGYDETTKSPFLRVSEYFEVFNGTVHKTMRKHYSTPLNLLEAGDIPMVDDGKLLSVRGSIDHEIPPVGSFPAFRELAFFSTTLMRSESYNATTYYSPKDEEGGMVVLINKNSGINLLVDPQKSYMPTAMRSGVQGEGLVRDVQYEQTQEGVWFPVMVTSGSFRNGIPLYRRICEVSSYEFNKTYPDSDFDIVFPAGTRVDDDLTRDRYIVEESQ